MNKAEKMRVFDQKNYKSKSVCSPMETITIDKKEYEKLKKLAGKEELTEMEIRSWRSTLEILQDKDMMDQLRESEKNRKKGIMWKLKF